MLMHSRGSQQSKNQSNNFLNKKICSLFHVQSAGSLRVLRKKKPNKFNNNKKIKKIK